MHVYREGSAASCMPVCTCLSRVVGLTWSLGKLAPEHPQPPDPPSESPASAWPPPPGHPRLPLGVNGMSQRARGLPLERLPLPTQEECQDGRGPWTVGTVQGGHKGRGPGDSLGVGRTGPDVWQIPVAGTWASGPMALGLVLWWSGGGWGHLWGCLPLAEKATRGPFVSPVSQRGQAACCHQLRPGQGPALGEGPGQPKWGKCWPRPTPPQLLPLVAPPPPLQPSWPRPCTTPPLCWPRPSSIPTLDPIP